MSNDQGVIYISTGEKYVEMTAMAAKSLKSHCPNLSVHIFTDRDVSSYGCFDSSTNISDPNTRYGCKVDYFLDSPYQNTLYLDADTRVCEDITHMFELMDQFEFAIAHDPGRAKHLRKYFGEIPFKKAKHQKKFISKAPKSFLPMNSGVILYKKTDAVIKFFKAWQKSFHEEGLEADQPTLREQLWLNELKIWVLTPEYNCRPKGYIKVLKSANISPKILHLQEFKREAGIVHKYRSKPIQKIFKMIKNYIVRRLIQGLPY
jgi:lipopolysaccharide biosynthesis glycosyltransferase